nr:glycosyltransferase [Chloroflexota bacterium]
DLAACLIQPTTLNHRLSTPNKLFEAIAAGVPLLAADLPAIAEIVRRWEVGWLVDPTDIDAIRHGLRSLIDQPELRAAMAERARIAAATELNWAHEFAALADLYDRVGGS